jgi:hypothetical protein
MLLTYRTGPSTHAVGEAIGATHQTVQRCLDRAVRFGAMAALEDSPRPGKAAAITDEARAWLVSLAWQKAKELGCFRTNSGRRACWRATSALMSRRLDIPAWGISFKTRSAKSSHAMTSSGSVAKLWLRPCRDKKVVGLATERLTVVDFKVSHFEREIVLWGVRWYVAYPISYRQLEEMMEERGVEVDHSSLNRCALKYAPLLGQAFRARKRQVGGSWRTDETYVRIRGQWKYL